MPEKRGGDLNTGSKVAHSHHIRREEIMNPMSCVRSSFISILQVNVGVLVFTLGALD